MHEPPPPAPTQEPDEPRHLYAARLLCYYLRHETTGTLDDEQIGLCEYAAYTATSARDRLPAYYETINRARHTFAAVLKARRAADEPATIAGGVTPHQDTGGRPVPLAPPPHTQPPAGEYADATRPDYLSRRPAPANRPGARIDF